MLLMEDVILVMLMLEITSASHPPMPLLWQEVVVFMGYEMPNGPEITVDVKLNV